MEKIVINGENKLNGSINISGSKNSALAIIPATILCKSRCILENVPDIDDIHNMMELMRYIGADVKQLSSKNTWEIDSTNISQPELVPYEYTKKLRASYYFLGALLGRFGDACLSQPGGDDFGTARPFAYHLNGFETLGASVEDSTRNAIHVTACDGLQGNTVFFDSVSVGATVNVMLAAVMANGKTSILNAAREPHIVDLANFLNLMGAKVVGAGTNEIKITGVKELKRELTTYSIIPDQIEAGTYMVATAAAGGDVTLTNVTPQHLESITAMLRKIGYSVEEYDDSVRIVSNGNRPAECQVVSTPHPGFPTDMQPQMATLLTICEGESEVFDKVWGNRYKYVKQLEKMGATFEEADFGVRITGVESLKGAEVKADDIRAGAAMVIAGLMAKGETVISEIHHIERGYEGIVQKLSSLGADIKKIDVTATNNI